MSSIAEILRGLVNPEGVDPCVMCDATVKSVNMDKRQCSVEIIFGGTPTVVDGVELVNEVEDGFLIKPKVGSTVKVIMTSKGNPFVAQYSEIERVWIVIGDNQIDMTATGIAAFCGDNVKVILTDSEITASAGDQQVNLQDGQTKWNDGSYDGLVKAPAITDRINFVEEDLNTSKTNWLSLIAAVTSAGGTPLTGTALGGLLSTAFAAYGADPMVPTTLAQIENPNITHGGSI